MKYAKLSLPRIHQALVRQRLFHWLDSARQSHPVVWICAPPGSGKTALAATYLAALSPPAIWYQIDQEDADPLTWFTFMAKAIGETGADLPLPSPQTLATGPDLLRFARRFFREFYARLPAGSVLVFDNLDEFDWAVAGELLEIAFNKMPDGLNILALSRESPPPRFARLSVSGFLTTLTWDQLRFADAEALAMAALAEPLDRHSRAWLDQVNGWAVGITLLREHHARHGRNPANSPLVDARDSAFRYFEGEILDRLPAASQEWLLMLSCLPGMSTDDAQHLTGDLKASRLLRRFYEHRFFVDRHEADQSIYHFHPLFREFLQAELGLRLGHEQRVALFQRAAAILDKRGNIDMAVQMYRDAGAFSALASLLLRRANDMLAAGRGASWREWLGWLPQPMLEADPWLYYWLGTSQNHVNPQLGKQALLRAEQIFRSLGDQLARLITIAAIIDSYYFGLNDAAGLMPWIDAIDDGLAQLGSATLDAESELQIYSRLTIGLMLARPDSPALGAHAQRTAQALGRATDPAKRLSAGAILLHCMDWLTPDTTRWIILELGGAVNDDAISPFIRGWWCIRAALWHVYFEGNLAQAQQINDTGLRLIANLHLDRLRFQLRYNKVLILLAQNQVDAALPLLNELKPMVAPSQKIDIARFSTLEANYSLQVGDIQKALQSTLDGMTQATQSGLPAAENARFDRHVAACYAQARQFELADQWYCRALEHASQSCATDKSDSIEARDLVRAYAQALNHDPAATPMLQAALSAHRQRGRAAFFVRFPLLAAAICALALDADIEKDHIRGIIRRQQLTPPGPFSANWPWPVAVRTLGSLTLSLNGDLLAFSGKTQQRPLVLLKALLLAPESGQTQQVIADHLWPDVADARASLNVTIHRLRKLLGNDDALLVAGGKLFINRALVWSDVDALSNLCDRIQTLPPEAGISELNQHATALLSLYRGPFSDGSDESWLLSSRNRWRNRFLEGATTLGMRLEKLNELSMANALYGRALEVEPLAETMYRNLMRCAHAQNDPSAAYSAYRRCRETLSVILGKRPSAETDRLAISIGLIESAG